jgi:hypothetical protein
MFIGVVQEPIDRPGAALLHDPRVLGLLPILEDFVISLVAHGILYLERTNSKATPQYGLHVVADLEEGIAERPDVVEELRR